MMQRLLRIYDKVIFRAAYTLAVCLGTSEATRGYFGNPVYHASGFLTALIGRTMDVASTLPVIQRFNSPEFRARQDLQAEFFETHLFCKKHPSLKGFLVYVAVQEPILLTLSAIFPPMGYAFLANDIFRTAGNVCIGKRLEERLEENREQQ